MNSKEETIAWGNLGECFKKVQDCIFSNLPSLSTTMEDVPYHQVKVINDNVYELYAPQDDNINVEIVFIHGWQQKPSKYPHVTTWLTRSKLGELWPRTWLGESYFSQARILSVSYDTLDLYREAENLVSTLIKNAKVGQRWGCPVVMVGHCLGGLLIKKLCVFLSNLSPDDQYAKNFVKNVRGLFFFATPHQGISFNGSGMSSSTLWKESKILNPEMARLNGDFERLRTRKKWRIGAIGESNQTKTIGNLMRFQHGVMILEASARHCTDMFYTANVGHFDVCKPINKTDSTFQTLVDFVQHLIQEEALTRQEPFTLPKHQGESLEIRVKEVERRLQKEKRLAIVGMGGIGKTSLAKAIFNAMSARFEYTCFVENLKDELKKSGTRGTLDGLVMENLCRGGKKMEPLLESRGFKSIVQGKLLLLILDDVDSSEQMDVIPESHLLAKRSRVIVTSRSQSKEIFPEVEFSLYKAQLLNDTEAHKLFCSYASKSREMPRELVKKVVNKCAGLPLTLQVIGSYLGSETCKATWEGAWKRLSHAESLNGSTNDKLWGKLRVSFDALAPMDQAMFVDCACFFACYGFNIFLSKAPWSVLGWKNLLDRCLVTEICDPYNAGIFPGSKMICMHQQLRDMGRNLAASSRLWQSRKQALQLLTSNDQDLRLNVEGLDTSRGDFEKGTMLTKVEVHGSTLAKMSKLRYLRLDMVDIHGNGPAFPPKVAHLRLLESLRLVPRVFSIFGYPQRSWLLHDNDLTNLANLAALHISSWSIGVQLPNKFGKLRNLKVLRLWTPELTMLPDSFCELSSLETLLIYSLRLEHLPDLFGELKSLQRLALFACLSLKKLPKSFGQLESLCELVAFCPKLWTLPTSLVNLPMSTNIRLGNIFKVDGEVRLDISDVVTFLSGQLEILGWFRDANSDVHHLNFGTNGSLHVHSFRHGGNVHNN